MAGQFTKRRSITMGTARRLVSRFALGAVMLAGLACGGGGGGDSTGGEHTLTDYVAGVKSSDGTLTAVHKTGAPPAATAPASRLPSARLAAATATMTFLRGGTATLPVSDGVTRVIVAIEGIDGYWELTGLTAGSGQNILVTFAQNGPDTFSLRLGGGDASSIFGYDVVPVALTTVGTGDVQVNVTWDLDVDVDLHVVDPSGEEIYYSNSLAASGGVLDLDSNAGCSLDHVKAENITWPSGKAPSGKYKVLVDYYEACQTGTVNYVVTVNVKGQAPQVFTKSFSATDADSGGTCFEGATAVCGTPITEFTVP
jgi:hypothetical protein